MNVLIATGIYPPEIGGPATVIADFAARLRQEGHAVDVVTYSDAPLDQGITRVSRRGSVFARYFRFHRALRRRIGPDTVIFVTDVFSVGIPTRFALIGKKNRFLLRLGGEWCWEDAVTNHGFRGTLREFWKASSGMRIRLMKMNYRWILKRAERIAVTSDLLRDVVSSLLPEPSAILVVSNVPSVAIARRTRTSAHDPLRLLYVGRFAPVKNLPFFARVLKQAVARGLHIACTFVGDGPDLGEVQTILADIPGMTFLGRRSHDEAVHLLDEQDVMVVPSLSDMAPNAAIEALANGMPVLITTVHGLPSPLPGAIECDPKKEEDWIRAIQALTQPDEYARLQSAAKPVVAVGSMTLKSFVTASGR